MLFRSPVGNFTGMTNCTVAVTDGLLNSTSQVLSINVTPVNDQPTLTAIPQQTIVEDVANAVNISAYASDVDGDTVVSLVVVENIAEVDCGVTGMNITFTPAANFSGMANCSVVVNDGSLNSTTQIIMINVTPVNDQPTLLSLPLRTVAEDTSGAYNLSVNASDVDGDSLSAVVISEDVSVVCLATGMNITYHPVGNFTGMTNCTVEIGRASCRERV